MTDECNKKEDGSACSCGGGSCGGGQSRWIWIILAVAIVAVLIVRNAGKKEGMASGPTTGVTPAAVETPNPKIVTSEPASQVKAIPRLVDLGATTCIPCKMMAPILDELKKTYVGKLDVQFIDVWKNPDAGKKYGIKVIPTQIFYDATGKELFRHEGFYGKEDILAKWKEFGVELPVASPK